MIQLHQQLKPKAKAAAKITASPSLVNGNSRVCFFNCFLVLFLMDYVHVLHTASLQTFSFTLQVYPCTNDKECEVGRYCHSPHQASSACMLCRRKKKRCHRDGMCCPGNRCNNGMSFMSCFPSKKISILIASTENRFPSFLSRGIFPVWLQFLF